MSLPKPPKQMIDYLPNGKTVCYDHHLRRCNICCMDFTYGESDEEAFCGLDYDDDSQGVNSGDEREEVEEDEEDERVFVLVGSTARFTPQWDEQILGSRIGDQIKKDYENSPKPLPLSDIRTTYCSTCQLTWLVGEIGEGAARTHPSHHCYSHIYAGTSRSLLVFTDGACSGNGAPGARGGLGVFFGPDSDFNISQRLTSPGIATNQKAELTAVSLAMDTVRSKILPARSIMVKGAPGGHDPRAVSDVCHLRLVIVTDSSYVVEGMCRHITNWKENTQGALVNKAKKIVANSEGFLRLKSEVEKLSMVGVQVVYYLVGREENREADSLARASTV